MTPANPRRSNLRRARGGSGFTLIELSISIVATSVLMIAMASSIFIASNAASTNNVSNAAMTTSLATAEIVSELAAGLKFSERTSTAVTFNVADRNGDLIDETIRYAWNGQPGSPLLRYYNGTSSTAVENIYSFSLGYFTNVAPVKKKVLLVRGNVDATRTEFDRNRRDLIHGLGYQVLPLIITAETPQSEINALLSVVDGVYLSATANASDVGTKFTSAAVGVLIEDGQLFDEFKLYGTGGDTFSDKDIRVDLNTHPITSGFAIGTMRISTSNPTLNCFRNIGSLAPDATVLCRHPRASDPTMIVVERGGRLTGGFFAAGRRVSLPWGTIDFDPKKILVDGETLLRRALTWATYDEVVTRVEVTLQVGSNERSKQTTQIEVISKPAL